MRIIALIKLNDFNNFGITKTKSNAINTIKIRSCLDGWCAKYDFHKEEINQIAVDEKGQYLVSCHQKSLFAKSLRQISRPPVVFVGSVLEI